MRAVLNQSHLRTCGPGVKAMSMAVIGHQLVPYPMNLCSPGHKEAPTLPSNKTPIMMTGQQPPSWASRHHLKIASKRAIGGEHEYPQLC